MVFYMILVKHFTDIRGQKLYYTGKTQRFEDGVVAVACEESSSVLVPKVYRRLCDAKRAYESLNRRCGYQNFEIEVREA